MAVIRNRNELLFARLKLPHASTSSHVYLNVFRGFEVSCFLMFITLEKESLWVLLASVTGKTGEYLVFWSVGSSSGCTLQLDSEFIWMLVIQ
jgi:hypothetical protein